VSWVSVGQSCIAVLDRVGTGFAPRCQKEPTLTGNRALKNVGNSGRGTDSVLGLSAKLFMDGTEAKDEESAVARTEGLNAGKKTL